MAPIRWRPFVALEFSQNESPLMARSGTIKGARNVLGDGAAGRRTAAPKRYLGPSPASDPLGFPSLLVFFPLVLVEQLLAQPDRLRGDLHQFVVLDIGQGLLQRHADRRR